MKTLELNIFTFSTGIYDCINAKNGCGFSSTAIQCQNIVIIYCQVFQTHSEGHQRHVRLRCDGYRIPFLKLL